MISGLRPLPAISLCRHLATSMPLETTSPYRAKALRFVEAGLAIPQTPATCPRSTRDPTIRWTRLVPGWTSR